MKKKLYALFSNPLFAAAVFAVLLLIKASNLIGNPQFWAEDGKIFFTQAREYRVYFDRNHLWQYGRYSNEMCATARLAMRVAWFIFSLRG